MTLQNLMRFGVTKLGQASLTICCCFLSLLGSAQDLAPRAYLITPVHSNAVTLTYSFFSGELLFDGAVPITDSTAKVNVAVVSYTHSLHILGRSANFSASLPYGLGNFTGTVIGNEAKVYRSGAFDSAYRLSINLKGGPAMDVREFRNWTQKTLLGFSFKVVAPTGQYDPAKLINYGTNRWAFKPELGLSRRWGHWLVDSYGAVWFFTANRNFFSGNQFSPTRNTQEQAPTFAFEGHLSYDVRPRLWASFDCNFWVGGKSRLNGVENPNTLQRNSRVGGTLSVPVSKHQSFKFSYNRGAYISYGGNYQNVSIGWQYSWVGKPN